MESKVIEIGKMQHLTVDRQTSVGLYLTAGDSSDKKKDSVLLPQKEAPENCKVGDEIEVFADRSDLFYKMS